MKKKRKRNSNQLLLYSPGLMNFHPNTLCERIGLIGALDLKKGVGSHLNRTYLPLSFKENSYEHMFVRLVHL